MLLSVVFFVNGVNGVSQKNKSSLRTATDNKNPLSEKSLKSLANVKSW